MKVTVCTPNYNLGQFIGETIKSVLAQTFTDFEYLIIDDCSTDNSLDVIRSFNDPRIRVIALDKNTGSPEDATNIGWAQAKGEYFSIIPSDDVWEPEYLEKVVAKLDKDPIYGACFTHCSIIGEDSLPCSTSHHVPATLVLENRTQEQWLDILYSGNALLGTVTIRLSIGIEPFKEVYGFMSDYEFFIRLVKLAPIYIVQEKLVKIRWRGDKNRSAPTLENQMRHLKHLGFLQRKYYRRHTAESVGDKVKLAIATPFYEMKGFSPYIVSLMKTARYLDAKGINWEFWEISGSSYVDRARNLLCSRFLESDFTHLLLIDSDEDWNPEAVTDMLSVKADVIGGAYPQKNNWNTWSSIPLDTPPKGVVLNGKAVIEAQIVSAGFMLIHRRALEKFEEHYPELAYADFGMDQQKPTRIYTAFFQTTITKGKYTGEDSTFCHRYREMGEKLWIYPDIDFGHYGVNGWYGNYDKTVRQSK